MSVLMDLDEAFPVTEGLRASLEGLPLLTSLQQAMIMAQVLLATDASTEAPEIFWTQLQAILKQLCLHGVLDMAHARLMARPEETLEKCVQHFGPMAEALVNVQPDTAAYMEQVLCTNTEALKRFLLGL
jgi:hypothetical protein